MDHKINGTQKYVVSASWDYVITIVSHYTSIYFIVKCETKITQKETLLNQSIVEKIKKNQTTYSAYLVYAIPSEPNVSS